MNIINKILKTVKSEITKFTISCNIYFWNKYYNIRYWLYSFLDGRGIIVLTIVLCLLVAASIYYVPMLQLIVEPYFLYEDRLSDLRSLFLALGGALLGATAIAFTLIMFVMQVNVERMPYGLFRKLSADVRIVWTFIVTFSISIVVASISLIPHKSLVAGAITSSVWGIIFIIIAFMYAYRRALLLINPTQQLSLMVKDVDREINVWLKRYDRFVPLYKRQVSSTEESLKSTHDLIKLQFFQSNPMWTHSAEQAIKYAISFAKKYAEQGDHEVSSAALVSVVNINLCYVKAKGKTFFTSNAFVENPYATDNFINDTLEHMRQTVVVGISRGDEQFIEQLFATFESLAGLYMSIDYSTELAAKTHAQLVSGYLCDSVKSVDSVKMVDVAMEGVYRIRRIAELHLKYNNEQTSVIPLINSIKFMACVGAINSTTHPLLKVSVNQLSRLTYNCMVTSEYEKKYIVKELRAAILQVVSLFLNVPDTPLHSVHSAYLGPYYSGTDNQSFLSMLRALTNAILEADDKNHAETVVNNVECWADGLYSDVKEILLLAIDKRSGFTFDIIHWIKSISEMLMAISNAEACDERTKKDLQKHAHWILATFTFIPKDSETIAFVECYTFTETLFLSTQVAAKRECYDVFENLQGYLLDWGFNAGRHETGQGIFVNSLCGLAVLSFTSDWYNPSKLKSQVTAFVEKLDDISKEEKNEFAVKLRNKASRIEEDRFGVGQIEYQMSKVNIEEMQKLLNELADLISPIDVV